VNVRVVPKCAGWLPFRQFKAVLIFGLWSNSQIRVVGRRLRRDMKSVRVNVRGVKAMGAIEEFSVAVFGWSRKVVN
jgi:hypothetical protein